MSDLGWCNAIVSGWKTAICIHTMGALSSIPLCSRRRGETGEGEQENRPEKLEENNEETIVAQTEDAIKQEEEAVDTLPEEQGDLIKAGTDIEIHEVLESENKHEGKIPSITITPDDNDGNEEVCLDNESTEVDVAIDDIDSASEKETHIKTDPTTAISTILSQIVMESDGREMVVQGR